MKRFNKDDELLELFNYAHIFLTGKDNSILALKEIILESRAIEEKERKGEK